MENTIKLDDLGGKPTIFGNIQIFPNSDTTKGPEPEDDPDAEQKERARLERQRMGGNLGVIKWDPI